MPYLVPPTGTPISAGDILRLTSMWIGAGSPSDMFERQIKNYSGAKYCYLFNSGRTALELVLRSIKVADKNKTDVIIPAYTCFSVAAAIAKSGMRIRPVDIDPLTLDYDYEKLRDQNFENVLAIIGCNLLGILSDWDELNSLAKKEEVYLIDDAAQSLGSSYRGKPSGTMGDAGFYSLGRGKNLSAISGGVLITDDEGIALKIIDQIKNIRDAGIIYNMKALSEIIIYSIFLRPKLYWLPDKMPFLRLGETIFDERFISGNLSKIQKCAGAILFPGLKKINGTRSRKAGAIYSRISGDDRYQVPGYRAENSPIYLRLPVLAQNRRIRDKLIVGLQRAGIKSSSMYPSTIRKIEGIDKYLAGREDDFEGAEAVVERLFTLPTHHYVKESDIERMTGCLTRS